MFHIINTFSLHHHDHYNNKCHLLDISSSSFDNLHEKQLKWHSLSLVSNLGREKTLVMKQHILVIKLMLTLLLRLLRFLHQLTKNISGSLFIIIRSWYLLVNKQVIVQTAVTIIMYCQLLRCWTSNYNITKIKGFLCRLNRKENAKSTIIICGSSSQTK